MENILKPVCTSTFKTLCKIKHILLFSFVLHFRYEHLLY